MDEFCHWLENNILRQKQNSLVDCFVVFCIERGNPELIFAKTSATLHDLQRWRGVVVVEGLFTLNESELQAIHRSSSGSRNCRRSGRAGWGGAGKKHEIYAWHLEAIVLFSCYPKHDWRESLEPLKLLVADPGFSAKNCAYRPRWSANIVFWQQFGPWVIFRNDPNQLEINITFGFLNTTHYLLVCKDLEFS